MKKIFICSKKSVRTLLLKLEPYFLSHAERGEPFQIQDFLGGIQNRRHFVPTIFLVPKPFSKNCGGGEIRTLDTFRYATFPRWWNKPLSDASIFLIYIKFLLLTTKNFFLIPKIVQKQTICLLMDLM